MPHRRRPARGPVDVDTLVRALRRWADARRTDVGPTRQQWDEAQQGLAPNQRFTGHRFITAFGSWRAANIAADLQPPRIESVTRDAAIQALQTWYAAHGAGDEVGPSMAQWRAYRADAEDQPTFDAIVVRRLFGSWQQGVIAAGLVPRGEARSSSRFTDDDMLDALRAWAAAHPDHALTDAAWRRHSADHPDAPTPKHYVTRFGSFRAALERAGLPVPRARVSRAELLEGFQAWARAHDGVSAPTATQWRTWLQTQPEFEHLGVKRYLTQFGSWTGACHAARLVPVRPRRAHAQPKAAPTPSTPSRSPRTTTWTRRSIVKRLASWVQLDLPTGVRPTTTRLEIDCLSDLQPLPSYSTIRRFFASWDDAMTAVNAAVANDITLARVVRRDDTPTQPTKAPLPASKLQAIAIAAFNLHAERTGRIPRSQVWPTIRRASPELPQLRELIELFGSWQEFVDAAAKPPQ